MNLENRVIALEGLDGTGKSTAGKLLAEQTSAQYLYCMDGNRFRSYRKRFDTAPTPVRFLYYLAVPLDNYLRIERLRASSDVLVDRTIASSIAYHKAYGLSDKWLKLIPPFLLNQIDTMVYFSLNPAERIKRVVGREVTQATMTESDKRSIVLGDKIDKEYRKIFPDRTLVVEVDNKTPQIIVNELKGNLYD